MNYNSEKKTGDVYDALRDSNSTNELVNHLEDLDNTFTDMSFSSYFNKFLVASGKTPQELATMTGIDTYYIYPILNGTQGPKRDRAIALCLAVGMTDEECIRCLERSNLGILYAKNKRDSVIIYAFRNKMSVNDLNAKLIDLGFNHLVVSKES